MDGTLVASPLDFARIRAELGVPDGQGILEALDGHDEPRRGRLHGRLLEMELDAADCAELMPHAVATLDAVRSGGLKTALLTRNAGPVMRTLLERFAGLRFDIAWAREDGPIKPEPDGVLRACRRLDVLPARTACVGDFHLDLVAANAAGAVSILLARPPLPDWAGEADHVIRSLAALPRLLGLVT